MNTTTQHPMTFKLPSKLTQSPYDPANAILREVCPAGEPWMGLVRKGQIFRMVDLEGNQAADTIFYNAHDTSERYSPSVTIHQSRQLYLGYGSKLYSCSSNVLATITADTCGRHDTIGGACSCESNTVRYAMEKRPMHSCRDNFMQALTNHPLAIKSGMKTSDVGANINFFMNVPVLENGELFFADGISGPGKYVEITAAMDLIVLISACPQLNNPCNDYNPTPVELMIWDGANHG